MAECCPCLFICWCNSLQDFKSFVLSCLCHRSPRQKGKEIDFLTWIFWTMGPPWKKISGDGHKEIKWKNKMSCCELERGWYVYTDRLEARTNQDHHPLIASIDLALLKLGEKKSKKIMETLTQYLGKLYQSFVPSISLNLFLLSFTVNEIALFWVNLHPTTFWTTIELETRLEPADSNSRSQSCNVSVSSIHVQFNHIKIQNSTKMGMFHENTYMFFFQSLIKVNRPNTNWFFTPSQLKATSINPP